MVLAAACAAPPTPPTVPLPRSPAEPEAKTAPGRLRLATFNIFELNSAKLAEVDSAGVGVNPQLRAAATIVQRLAPDVLLVQEIDLPETSDGDLEALLRHARELERRYLANVAPGSAETPVSYPHIYVASTNTGVLSGFDLNGDGVVASEADRGERRYGDDAYGFGTYPGQYAMAVLSKVPLIPEEARTFQRFRWIDLPGHHFPEGFYPAGAKEKLRLSSKSHWDLPIEVGGRRLHLLISHPTPPAFDGVEDRNGRRNHDEILFWVRYLDGAAELYDDAGKSGGYGRQEPFVILGDLNAAPLPPHLRTGVPSYEPKPAIEQLLEHPRVQDSGIACISGGGMEMGAERFGPPDYPERSTADFLGGMRVDYVLPSTELKLLAGGVFWPAVVDDAEGAELAAAASDHRLVWIEVELPHP